MEFHIKVKAARALLEWTQEDLARHSGEDLTAIKDFEARPDRYKRSKQRAPAQIKKTLERHGIEFLEDGVLLRKIN